ncbi:hypothetical protein CWB99_13545 [Pseudoalteromonas rubra]|uniref:Lipoprotein n=1 Tax=Pseudoalteromonas rubra TaxID=43658 RepID=A0A5S3WJZ6_9GAMM|nr:hypothetical protein [Pseudoalteromonas rubra]TMP27712.1 hypothetical protein CWB99_13545 [Pseudoalteromonas rubra]
MKNVFISGFALLLLLACTDSPSVDDLIDNTELMSVIQKAAQRDVSNVGMIPIALDVGSLAIKKLISNSDADKIRELTNCPNLSGVELTFARDRVTHVKIIASNCVDEG